MNKWVYALAIPGLLYYIIFCYFPMYGLIIAFEDYVPNLGFTGSPWVGFEHFIDFFTGDQFWRLLKNTLALSIEMILITFPAPIILALMLNELRGKWFKKTVQTITYLPHFISMVVICGMVVEFMKHTGILMKPAGISFEAYKLVLQKPEIFIGYGNTLFYVVIGTIVNMLLTVSFGYVLSRKDLYWNKVLSPLVVFTMFFGGGMIPTYVIVQSLGLIDSRWAVILPTAINTFNMIIIRTAFSAVPQSLEEAAKVDGASPIIILFRIMLPLTLPTIAVIVLYYAVAHWNSWFNEMLYLRDQSKFPLQLFLREILINNTQEDMLVATGSASQMALGEIIKYATIIVSTLPILFVYPFLQKYFTKGVMVGAVKG